MLKEEIYTKNSPKRFVHEGCLEVLDEGVGGSLTTHLQEVLPATRGEQILTSKETPGTYAHFSLTFCPKFRGKKPM